MGFVIMKKLIFLSMAVQLCMIHGMEDSFKVEKNASNADHNEIVERFQKLEVTEQSSNKELKDKIASKFLNSLMNHTFTNAHFGLGQLIASQQNALNRIAKEQNVESTVTDLPYKTFFIKRKTSDLVNAMRHKFGLTAPWRLLATNVLSPDQTMVAVDTGLDVFVTNLLTNQTVTIESDRKSVYKIIWSLDSKKLGILSNFGINVYDAESCAKIYSYPTSYHDKSSLFDFSPSGAQLVISECIQSQRFPKVIDLLNKKVLVNLRPNTYSSFHVNNFLIVHDVKWSSDGKNIAVLSQSFRGEIELNICDVLTGKSCYLSKISNVSKDNCIPQNSVHWHPNNQLLLLKTDYQIFILDTVQDKIISKFSIYPDFNFCRPGVHSYNTHNLLSWHPKQPLVALGALKLGKSEKDTLQSENFHLYSDLYVWNYTTGESIFSQSYQAPIASVSWNKDGKNLLLGVQDKIIKLDFTPYLNVVNSYENMSLQHALLLKAIKETHLKTGQKFRLDEGTTEIFFSLSPELKVALSPLVIVWNGFSE